jgi:hypothetical protein
MPPLTRPTIVYLLLAVMMGLAAAAFGPVTRAFAATDTVSAVYVGSQNTNEGALQITLDSDADISALAVHLLDSSATDVLDTAMTLKNEGPNSSGGYQSIWSIPTAITEGTPPAGIPVGDYTVTLDVTFTDSTTTSVANAGTFAFTAIPWITISATPTVVSYGHYNVTVSGNVTWVHPNGTVSADGPAQVTLSGSMVSGVTVATDANGDFSTDVVAPTGLGNYSFWVDAWMPDGRGGTVASNTVTINSQVDPATITAALSAPTVTYGHTETFSGQVTYQDPGSTGFTPAPSTTVYVYSAQMPYTPTAWGTTDANGHYSIQLPDITGTTWTAEVYDPMFSAPTVSAPEAVNLPTSVTRFNASLNQYWQLSYSGCLTTAVSSLTPPTGKGFQLQFAGSAKGPWYPVKAGFTANSHCDGTGLWFSGKTPAPVNFAYYRVAYGGGTTAATPTSPGFLGTASGATLAWKYADRIVSFGVSPKVVAKNGKVTVKGQLQYYANAAWHNYGGQVVEIIFRQQGSSNWYWIVKVTTSSTGHFSAAVPVAGIGNATWSAQFNGNSNHLATAAAGVNVRVTG